MPVVSAASFGAPCRTPARTVQVGTVPRPRIRPLAEVLAAYPASPMVGVAAPGAVPVADPLDAALDALARAARPAALSLFGMLAEILDGRRPPAHLRPLCDEELYARFSTLLTADRVGAGRQDRSRVRGIRVCAVAPAAAEVSAVLDRDGRARALAARLERPDRRWRLTALVVG